MRVHTLSNKAKKRNKLRIKYWISYRHQILSFLVRVLENKRLWVLSPKWNIFINPPTRAKAQGTSQRGELEDAEELSEMPSCGHGVAAALTNSQQLWSPRKTKIPAWVEGDSWRVTSPNLWALGRRQLLKEGKSFPGVWPECQGTAPQHAHLGSTQWT